MPPRALQRAPSTGNQHFVDSSHLLLVRPSQHGLGIVKARTLAVLRLMAKCTPRQRRSAVLGSGRTTAPEDDMPQRPLPTEKEVKAWIRDRRNWGRWGKDDQLGAMNLITPAKRVAATRTVKSGRTVSLSRPFPKEPGINNTFPAQHFMKTHPRGSGGFAADFYGIYYH